MPIARTPYPSKRTAPRKPGMLQSDDITWTRTLDLGPSTPREAYRILYCDRFGKVTEREIELRKIGNQSGCTYLGVMEQGKFKSLRLDRVRGVVQLSVGHEPSIRALPTYDTVLPAFPLQEAVYKVATVAKSNRRWTVNLNLYTCTCPEKRERLGRGYKPGQLGFVCPHIARAIVEHLPRDAGWQPELLEFLGDPRRVHLDNLTAAG